MNINNPDDWKFIASNKYGSGTVVTATFKDHSGEVLREFEVDHTDPTGQYNRGFIATPVVDRAVTIYDSLLGLVEINTNYGR